jgi:hypothetical protein
MTVVFDIGSAMIDIGVVLLILSALVWAWEGES